MGNSIWLKRLPTDDSLHMSNGYTSSFINIFGLSGSAAAKTDHEKMLVVYVLERNQSVFGAGCVDFDVGWMPWDANNIEGDRQFLLSVVEGMKNKVGWERLDYTPDEAGLRICIDRFEHLVMNMTKDDIDAENVQWWLNIQEPDDPKYAGFPLCPVHQVFMTQYGCQLCTD